MIDIQFNPVQIEIEHQNSFIKFTLKMNTNKQNYTPFVIAETNMQILATKLEIKENEIHQQFSDH